MQLIWSPEMRFSTLTDTNPIQGERSGNFSFDPRHKAKKGFVFRCQLSRRMRQEMCKRKKRRPAKKKVKSQRRTKQQCICAMPIPPGGDHCKIINRIYPTTWMATSFTRLFVNPHGRNGLLFQGIIISIESDHRFMIQSMWSKSTLQNLT